MTKNYMIIPQTQWERLIAVLDLIEEKRTNLKWLSARQTGLTKEQLRYIRETQPRCVRPTKPNTRSYLYNMEELAYRRGKLVPAEESEIGPHTFNSQILVRLAAIEKQLGMSGTT
jgi:hypothetical protein